MDRRIRIERARRKQLIRRVRTRSDMWPIAIIEQTLIAVGRHCCICHAFCGTKFECHHIVSESDGGASTLSNCIPLCFNCHADVGHYNPRHPKGTKYSASELKGHRDTWFSAMSDLRRAE